MMTPPIPSRRAFDNEDWPSYQRMVLDKLDNLENSVAKLNSAVTNLRVEMATQKTKMTMIGASMGLVAAACAEFVWRMVGVQK